MRMPNDRQHKWDDRYYVQSYQLALSGFDDAKIARLIGVRDATFHAWVMARPALEEALRQARTRGAGTRMFMRYISNQVPDDLKELWEQLSSDDDNVRRRAHASAKMGDKRTLQHLFVHAYIAMNFNEHKASEACGIGPITAQVWKRDKDFKRMLDVIKSARSEFGQNALMEKIHEGDTAAIIFFNKTFNKDLGYDTRVNVKVSGEVEHKRTVSLGDLTVEEKRMLLDKIRSKRQVEALPDNSNVVDAEFSLKEKETT